MSNETTTQASQDENKLIAERRSKLDAIREKGNAFPNDFRPDDKSCELQAAHGEKSKEELEALDHKVSVAGRIMAKRGPFMVLQDGEGTIQLYADKAAQEHIKETWGLWDIGDIVGIKGALHKSGKGDLYVNLEEYQLLTKSLRPLPDKYHGLSDQEIRYRQRYVDLIVNPEVRDTFRLRSQCINFIRNYMTTSGFMEVETPMLHVIPGGASARPFVTHHNALDMEMFLRIAPELYLKRLVVGGFERVFEINRNFRNEGVSTRHNPEFTMMEFYQAYADYKDLMDLTEDLLRKLCIEVTGNSVLKYQESEYDFGKPFNRFSMFDSILHYNPTVNPEELRTVEGATKIAEGLGLKIKAGTPIGKIQTEIFEETVEHRLDQPTFITEYPIEVSPLARRSDTNPGVTDRFEFFIGGRELANGFSELNDAEDQAQRFHDQVAAKDAGDDEAMYYDADFVRALEYGLPPTAGEGIGIDRLIMLFANAPSIRDVLLFPHMRPE
jgi:lysyl-tRNA synthetase class 2